MHFGTEQTKNTIIGDAQRKNESFKQSTKNSAAADLRHLPTIVIYAIDAITKRQLRWLPPVLSPCAPCASRRGCPCRCS